MVVSASAALRSASLAAATGTGTFRVFAFSIVLISSVDCRTGESVFCEGCTHPKHPSRVRQHTRVPTCACANNCRPQIRPWSNTSTRPCPKMRRTSVLCGLRGEFEFDLTPTASILVPCTTFTNPITPPSFSCGAMDGPGRSGGGVGGRTSSRTLHAADRTAFSGPGGRGLQQRRRRDPSAALLALLVSA